MLIYPVIRKDQSHFPGQVSNLPKKYEVHPDKGLAPQLDVATSKSDVHLHILTNFRLFSGHSPFGTNLQQNAALGEPFCSW